MSGSTLVAFTAFEYRKTDIDPYNEFYISFPITFRKRAIPGITVLGMMARRYFTAYVWQLTVTTERARKGGVEMYGYPKFLADISFPRENDAFTCTLSEGGKNIFVLKGQKLKTAPEKVNRFKTFSVKDGVPLASKRLYESNRIRQIHEREGGTTHFGQPRHRQKASGDQPES